MTTPNTTPLAYVGNDSINARDTVYRDRSPTVNDFRGYKLGDRWIVNNSSQAFILVSKTNNQAIWQLIGGGPIGSLNTLTPQVGLPVFPIAGNINVSGSPTYGLRTSNGGAGSFLLENIREPYTYVVSDDGTKEFTSIQAAINQAVLDGHIPSNPAMVYVMAGTYTEDLTLAGGIIVYGQTSDALLKGVTLNGAVTANAVIGNNFFAIQGFSIRSTVADAITITGVIAARCDIVACNVTATVGFGGILINSLSGTFGIVNILDCTINGDTFGIFAINRNIIGCSRISVIGSSGVAASFDNTCRFLANFSSFTSNISNAIDFLGTNFSEVQYCKIFSPLIGATISAASILTVVYTSIEASDASTFFVSGTGTINEALLTLRGTATVFDPGLTIVSYPVV